MKLTRSLSCLCVILNLVCTSLANSSEPTVDVFWIDRYGDIPWEIEKIRLDNFTIALMNEPDMIGYIIGKAGQVACQGEAQARAMRAKRYMMEVRGVPWNRVAWRDIGYREKPETVLYLFPRGSAVPYTAFSYEPSDKEQIIKDCSLQARPRRRRGKG